MRLATAALPALLIAAACGPDEDHEEATTLTYPETRT